MSPGSRASHGTLPEKFPAMSRMVPRTTIATPNPKSNLPSSRMETASKSSRFERKLSLGTRGGGRESAPQMGIGGRRRLATIRAADDVADLEQKRLDDFGEGLGLVVDGRRNGLETARS